MTTAEALVYERDSKRWVLTAEHEEDNADNRDADGIDVALALRACHEDERMRVLKATIEGNMKIIGALGIQVFSSDYGRVQDRVQKLEAALRGVLSDRAGETKMEERDWRSAAALLAPNCAECGDTITDFSNMYILGNPEAQGLRFCRKGCVRAWHDKHIGEPCKDPEGSDAASADTSSDAPAEATPPVSPAGSAMGRFLTIGVGGASGSAAEPYDTERGPRPTKPVTEVDWIDYGTGKTERRKVFDRSFLEHAAITGSQYDGTCRLMAAHILALLDQIGEADGRTRAEWVQKEALMHGLIEMTFALKRERAEHQSEIEKAHTENLDLSHRLENQQIQACARCMTDRDELLSFVVAFGSEFFAALHSACSTDRLDDKLRYTGGLARLMQFRSRCGCHGSDRYQHFEGCSLHKPGSAPSPDPEEVAQHPASPERVVFWAAVNEYAQACGGTPGQHTSSPRRMEAVAAIEAATAALPRAS